MEDTLFSILEDITGTDEVRDNPEVDLFEEGLMDSLATVQLLVEIEGQLGVQVPVSEFDRRAIDFFEVIRCKFLLKRLKALGVVY